VPPPLRRFDPLSDHPRLTGLQRAAADRLQRDWEQAGERAIARAMLPDGTIRVRSATKAVIVLPDGTHVDDTRARGPAQA
jgi:hypothetical protein